MSFGSAIRSPVVAPGATVKIAPSLLDGSSRLLASISSTYSVPSGPNARSIALVNPVIVRTISPLCGSMTNTFAPPTGNGKPVSWLTYR